MFDLIKHAASAKDAALMIVFALAFLFMVFSAVGWVIELFYRRFVSTKKWINPGFLRGPYLPIYGIGVIVAFAFVAAMELLRDFFAFAWLFDVAVIVGIGLLMTLIEFVGGLIFIKGMKIRLWDYRGCRGNIMGIICPQYTLYWTITGALFYYLLYTPICRMVEGVIGLDWFALAVFLMGMFYGVFALDLVYSLELVSKIKAFAEEKQFVVKWENFKVHVKEELSKEKVKSYFLAPFKSPHQIAEHLKKYFEERKKK